MDLTFWKEIAQQFGITGILLAIAAVFLKPAILSYLAKHTSEAGALQIKDELIKQLRSEARERDADWQLRWDRREKEALEYRQRVEREFRVFRSVSKATVADIKTLAAAGANTIPEDRLETTIHITGMGPLDP
jgi:hypothetical protein